MGLVLNKGKTLGSIADPIPGICSASGMFLREETPASKSYGKGRSGQPSDFDTLCAWEQGKLSTPETLAFFQDLVSTGQAWKSTGAVRRMAAQLIRGGLIHR